MDGWISGWIEERKDKRTDVRIGGQKKGRQDRRRKDKCLGRNMEGKGEQKESWK